MATRLAGPPPALHPRISEADFQGLVTDLATLRGWRWYHTHDARRSPAGFPDLILVQVEWLALLHGAGIDADVWRPGDWLAIVATLGAPTTDGTGRASIPCSRARGGGDDAA